MFRFEVFFALFLLAACTKNMAVQPKFQAEGVTSFFADQRTMRAPLPETVAVDQPDANSPLESGLGIAKIPLPITAELLKVGQTRYNIYCTPCHDRAGEGHGIVVQRGFQNPKSFTDLPAQSDGDLFHTVTFGKGNMAGYRSFLPRDERWAIVAYVRALQLSENFPIKDLESEDRAQLEKGP